MSCKNKIRKALNARYKTQRKKIEERLAHFESVGRLPREKLFEEFAFCILTPQSNAFACDAAVKRLVQNGLLRSGSASEIAKHLTGVRFHNNKAEYLVQARKDFEGIMAKLDELQDDFHARNFLAENVQIGRAHV